MALDDVKQSVEQNLTNAYDKALDKGATEPENKNLENLASTIDSIVGGEVVGYSVKSVINEDGETQTLKITTGGGIQPEGTVVLETNGTHDVSQYEFAEVNVPSEEPTLVTKEITENGTYNATDDNADGYSSVVVNIESSGGGGEEVIQETYAGTDIANYYAKIRELMISGKLSNVKININSEITCNGGKNLTVTAGSISTKELTYKIGEGTIYIAVPGIVQTNDLVVLRSSRGATPMSFTIRAESVELSYNATSITDSTPDKTFYVWSLRYALPLDRISITLNYFA